MEATIHVVEEGLASRPFLRANNFPYFRSRKLQSELSPPDCVPECGCDQYQPQVPSGTSSPHRKSFKRVAKEIYPGNHDLMRNLLEPRLSARPIFHMVADGRLFSGNLPDVQLLMEASCTIPSSKKNHKLQYIWVPKCCQISPIHSPLCVCATGCDKTLPPYGCIVFCAQSSDTKDNQPQFSTASD